jgi:hypothetical protein
MIMVFGVGGPSPGGTRFLYGDPNSFFRMPPIAGASSPRRRSYGIPDRRGDAIGRDFCEACRRKSEEENLALYFEDWGNRAAPEYRIVGRPTGPDADALTAVMVHAHPCE